MPIRSANGSSRHVGQAVNDREVEELKRLASTIIAEMKNPKRPRLPVSG